MTFTAESVFTYIIVAFCGFAVRYIWDRIVRKGEQTEEKAKNYDAQAIDKHILEIVEKTIITYQQKVNASISANQSEARTKFDYYQKMYWEAVNNLRDVEKDFKLLKEQNLNFYKYQLINTCKKYLAQGKMTQYQFDRLTELHKIYNSLGGNSQGDLYYNKTMHLPIAKEGEYVKVDHDDDELFVTSEDMQPHK